MMCAEQTYTHFFGRYELGEEIGRGGMATVYRGYDTTLKRQVAIKVLHKHLHTNEQAKARFEQEARAVARLNSSAMVKPSAIRPAAMAIKSAAMAAGQGTSPPETPSSSKSHFLN